MVEMPEIARNVIFSRYLMCAAHTHTHTYRERKRKNERKAKQTIFLASCSVTTFTLLCAHALLQCHYIIHMVFGCIDGSISSANQLYTNHSTTKRIRILFRSYVSVQTTTTWQKKINNFFHVRNTSLNTRSVPFSRNGYILLYGSEIGKKDMRRKGRRAKELRAQYL